MVDIYKYIYIYYYYIENNYMFRRLIMAIIATDTTYYSALYIRLQYNYATQLDTG